MHIAPINNNYSNKYNNRTSFKSLKIGGMLETKPDLMKKIQESIPIAKVAEYWQERGSNLKVDFSVDYHSSGLLDLCAVNKGMLYTCKIHKDMISDLNTNNLIASMKMGIQKNFTGSSSGMKKML